MSALDLDRLFTLAGETPALEAAEAQLTAKGRTREASALNKLQQDAGVQIDREMTGTIDEVPGPTSAQLKNAFEPVTFSRVAMVLSAAHGGLDDGPAKDSVAQLMSQLKPPSSPKPATGMKP